MKTSRLAQAVTSHSLIIVREFALMQGISVPTRIAPIREAMARSVPHTELVELGYLSGYPLFAGLR
jgi:hypothetical protein